MSIDNVQPLMKMPPSVFNEGVLYSRIEPWGLEVKLDKWECDAELKAGEYNVFINSIMFSQLVIHTLNIAKIKYTSKENYTLESPWTPMFYTGSRINVSLQPGVVNNTEYNCTYNVKYRTAEDININNYKTICSEVTIHECPFDQLAYKEMDKCLFWRRRDSFGHKCNELYRTHDINGREKQTTISNFCVENNTHHDCVIPVEEWY